MRWKRLSSRKELSVLLWLAGSLTMLTHLARPADLLIPAGSIWNYLDNGTDPGNAWQAHGFDDSAWLYGAAQLGYGDGDEVTIVRSNRINTTRIITTYFRRTFVVEDASGYSNLCLRLLRDDGAVVYLNGAEIYRSNMPTGVVNSLTLASANMMGPEETTYQQKLLTASNLLSGSNILAVEIHQSSSSDTDMSFDLALWGNYTNSPPTVSLVSPANGWFCKPGTNLTLTANPLDPDSAISRVEFFENTTKLAERTNAPYTMVWSNLSAGVYQFLAVATDVQEAFGTSSVARVNVVTNYLPSITYLSPANNSSFKLGANISISILSSDREGPVARMEFYEGTNKIGERTAIPFSMVWSNVPVGYYAITAAATDNVGGTSTSAVVNVSVVTNFLPTITLTTPTNNSIMGGPANLLLTATASDADGAVSRVELFADGVSLGESASTGSPYSLFWSNTPAAGKFVLTAVATDDVGGAKTSAPVTIFIQSNHPPVVNLTSPLADSLLKVTNLTLTASAWDYDGSIVKVEFSEGENKVGEDTVAPFSTVWSNVPPGSYWFRAIATDNSGATSVSAAIPVRIETNLPPSMVISSPTNTADIGGPLDLLITAAVTDTDGGVAQVEYFSGDTSLAVVTSEPFSLTWSNLGIGSYVLTAIAADCFGALSTSAPVTFSIHTNALPQVALTNPVNNAWVKAGTNLTITATATDSDGSIRVVEFFEGANKLGERTNSPFTLVWSNIAVGNYTLTANGKDNSGYAVTSTPVSIRVATNFLPAVSFTRPTNGAVLGGPLDLPIILSASDPDGSIRLLEVFVGETKLGEMSTNPFAITWSNAPWGNFTLQARATDNLGDVTTSAPVNITIRSNIAPNISIVSPRNNSTVHYTSNLTITASASDPDGWLRKIEFFADAVRLGEATTNPYSIIWSNLVPGVYLLSATATDFAGASKTSVPVQVTVGTNLGPRIAITNPANHAVFTSATNVVLQISAVDPDGTVEKVEVFQASTKIAELVETPYSLGLSNLLPGSYTFRAQATDNNGDTTLSAPVTFALRQWSTLVATGSVWKYLDDGSDQGTAWRMPGFDDGQWASGRAQLGYGDGDEATLVRSNRQDGSRILTTYFRYSWVAEDVSQYPTLLVRLMRDDGGIVYLNGTEVYRSNMPTNSTVKNSDTAAATLDGPDENAFFEKQIRGSLLISGTNLLAVEIHQINTSSSDVSFDLELAGFGTNSIIRQPYLQQGTPTNVLVRWRTGGETDTRVLYGTDPANLDQIVENPALTREHMIQLTGLLPATKYYYSIGTRTEILAGGIDYAFTTAPLAGSKGPNRIWLASDMGAVNSAPWNVQDTFLAYTGLRPPVLWVTSGDNAHYDGVDDDYQRGFFDMWGGLLKQSAIWTAPGNHDLNYLTSNLPPTMPYLVNFSQPTLGEAGGVPSGNKLYYSFDFANIHFVSLDSQYSSRQPGSPMLQWLEQDLASNKQRWLIAMCHHSPYGKIGNDCDVDVAMSEVRTNIVPILEAHNVDLAFSGHDHGYERSFLLDRYYQNSTNFSSTNVLNPGTGKIEEDGPYFKSTRPVAHQGAVFVVAGTSSRLDSAPNAYNPAFFTNRIILGSVILDVGETNLDLAFVNTNGLVEDHFTIIKTNPPNSAPLTQDLAISTLEDTGVTFEFGASDPDDDALTGEILSLPTNGILSYLRGDGTSIVVTNGSQVEIGSNLFYLPSTNFFGADQFTFLARDWEYASAPAAINLTVLPVNDAPVADASATLRRVISPDNASAVVVLDGSRSYDVEGDDLQFLWRDANGEVLGTGIVAVVRLPVGRQVLTLEVDDGQAKGTTQIAIEVIPPGLAVQPVNDRLGSAILPANLQKPLLNYLREAMEAFAQDHSLSGYKKLQLFQKSANAKLAVLDPQLAAELTAAIQEIMDALFAPTNAVPAIVSLYLKNNDQWRLNFSATPGQQYIIEASSNLVDWIPVGQGHPRPDGNFEFEGNRAGNLKFFRTSWVQKAIRATDAKEVGVGEPR